MQNIGGTTLGVNKSQQLIHILNIGGVETPYLVTHSRLHAGLHSRLHAGLHSRLHAGAHGRIPCWGVLHLHNLSGLVQELQKGEHRNSSMNEPSQRLEGKQGDHVCLSPLPKHKNSHLYSIMYKGPICLTSLIRNHQKQKSYNLIPFLQSTTCQ